MYVGTRRAANDRVEARASCARVEDLYGVARLTVVVIARCLWRAGERGVMSESTAVVDAGAASVADR